MTVHAAWPIAGGDSRVRRLPGFWLEHSSLNCRRMQNRGETGRSRTRRPADAFAEDDI
jgi:hypothetical protein